MASDPYRIETKAELRSLIGEPMPGIAAKVSDHLDEFAVAFIERSPFLLLATAGTNSGMDVSPKGDAAGFVLIEDENTLLIPDRPGNRLTYGHENVLENPQVGIIFLIPNTNETLRVNGRAELTRAPDLLERLSARTKPAVLVVRVHVEEVFFHCAKAFIRSNLWKPENWGEKHRVSFGEMIGQALNASDEVKRAIDVEVEKDYETNL